MAIFKCKMCGGQLEISENSTVCTCDYCGTEQTLPRLDSDKKANLYDRANHFRRNNDYDKAMAIYEQVLNEDSTDAEAYWSLVICKYGIEYVEDPSTHKRIPTVNRAQYTSIFDDEDYKAALEYADTIQKIVYEKEANAINEIQKGILEISNKEEPFDVFICYKETDESGRRTRDSVLANDLYHQLVQEGFKVFFARITLEDKLGQEYEPYIFAALNSAKAMIVIGTKPEYFNAVWVKNEWSRYLALIKNGEKKVLIPAYKDMDPYDLPEEFSHLQAQDMGKLGFMQDLIRGIKKIIGINQTTTVTSENVVIQQSGGLGNINALLKRGSMALEDGEWDKADAFFEEVLNQDAENGEAYWGKFLSREKCSNVEKLKEHYIKKYQNVVQIQTCLACEPDEKHISEQIRQYKIPGYLGEDEIREAYRFQLEYKSELESRKHEKQLQLSEINSDKLFSRCMQYATNITKEMLEDFISSLEKELENRISVAKLSDEKKSKEIKANYDYFVLHDADLKVKSLYDQAKELQKKKAIAKENAAVAKENRYQKLIHDYEIAKSLSDFTRVKKEFRQMDSYKDAKKYVLQCELQIETLHFEMAVEKFHNATTKNDYVEARNLFRGIKDYNIRETKSYLEQCEEKIKYFEEEATAEKRREEAKKKIIEYETKIQKIKRSRRALIIWFIVVVGSLMGICIYLNDGYWDSQAWHVIIITAAISSPIWLLMLSYIRGKTKEIKNIKRNINDLYEQKTKM